MVEYVGMSAKRSSIPRTRCLYHGRLGRGVAGSLMIARSAEGWASGGRSSGESGGMNTSYGASCGPGQTSSLRGACSVGPEKRTSSVGGSGLCVVRDDESSARCVPEYASGPGGSSPFLWSKVEGLSSNSRMVAGQVARVWKASTGRMASGSSNRVCGVQISAEVRARRGKVSISAAVGSR